MSEIRTIHECEGSRKAGVSIRYDYPMHFTKGQTRAWAMWAYVIRMKDGDGGGFVEEQTLEIRYCPYCGKRLREPKEEP